MKRIFTMLALSFVLAACSEPSVQKDNNQEVTLVQLTELAPVQQQSEFSFPAVVSAVKTIDVSFEVTGRLEQLDLVQGTKVKKGDLLAAINDEPFERRVEEQQARVIKADRDLNRIEKLYEKGLASQSNLDNARTQLDLAQIDLKLAKQDLGYTKLYAPFDATISERVVDNNNFVRAGDTVARLQDVSKIYFDINVPERLLSANRGSKIAKAVATLVSSPNKEYDIVYVEHSTQLEPYTQTYKAVFAMDPIEGFEFTPGARAQVKVTIDKKHAIEGLVLPMSALVGDKNKGFSVWVFEQAKQTVIRKPVQVITVSGKHVVIAPTIASGEKVVSAGANKMFAGIKVKEYQAEL